MDFSADAPVTFPGRVGLQQMALSAFRVPVVERLAQACERGLCVFAGERRAQERREPGIRLAHATYAPARNVHLLRGSLALCWQRGLLRWLASFDPDVLIAEANPRTITTSRAVRWMHRRGRPVLGWGLGTMSLGGGALALRRAGRTRFLRQFDGLIAYSTRAAREYEAVGFPAERIFVAFNACTPRAAVRLPSRDPRRNGPLTVLSVGRLQPGKRVDLLIRACAGLPQPRRPRLVIVGDGPARPELEALARTENLDTHFLGGLFGKDLAPVFDAADLFVLPGLGGLAVQEAMAHGLPVVVAEGDGTQFDLVRPGNGWHVSPADTEALGRAVGEALADPARLRAMGAESARIIAQEINIETMVDRIVLALRTVSVSGQSRRQSRTSTSLWHL